MKAIVVHETGGPEKLTLEEVSDPEPGDNDLLVEVAAAGLNFIDTYHRDGLYPMEMPIILGIEGVGRVVATGDAVENVAVGERVGWVIVQGSYAERLVVPEDQAIPIPDEIDDAIAAAVLLQGVTAHYLATDTYPLSAGDRCLIHAGAGGVGLLLTQIAKLRGAEVVTTVGTEQKAALSLKAGSDHVIVYTTEDFKEAVESIYGAHALDVVFDGVGASTFERGLDLLRPRGMMVTFGNASGPPPEISPLVLAQKGSLFLTRPTMAHYMQTPEELQERTTDVFSWIREGRLKVRIGAEYPLAEAADAHRALEGRDTTGKVLIRP